MFCVNVNKLPSLFLLVFALLLTSTVDCSADVFDRLSKLGDSLGTGLAKSGYFIAGLGLIAFSVAAIFGKISWKTLAYIMLSTFILTALLSKVIYNSLQVNGNFYALGEVKFNGVSGNGSAGGDATSVPVTKSQKK